MRGPSGFVRGPFASGFGWKEPVKSELKVWKWVISSHGLAMRGIGELEEPYASGKF